MSLSRLTSYTTPLVLIVFFIQLQVLNAQLLQSNELGHEKWEYVLEDAGDVLQIALPLAAAITTVIKKDWDGSKQLFYSYSSSLIITYTLKQTIRKQRPEGRHLFDAFPSGHTTSAFSGASFIQRRYGWKYGKWAYLLAAVVGVSRMEGPDGWHDLWDVLAGASVGIGSTYIFTKPYEGKTLDLGFLMKDNSYLLTLNIMF